MTKEVKVEVGNTVMSIKTDRELTEAMIETIKNLNLPIFWSDSRGIHWSYDTKIADGIWLENIKFNNELTKAEAIIVTA